MPAPDDGPDDGPDLAAVLARLAAPPADLFAHKDLPLDQVRRDFGVPPG